jgi:L-amino acid N-acyltransferase
MNMDNHEQPVCPGIMFRAATFSDMDGIKEIYNYYIKNSNNSWRYQTLDDDYFKEWLQKHPGGRRPAFVAVNKGKIIGYSSLSDFRSGEGYWPCAEDSIYVMPDYIGQHIGRQLMQMIISQGRISGLKAIIAGIDADNEKSIRFHESFGFKNCGVLKDIGWKNDSWRSVVFLQLDLY